MSLPRSFPFTAAILCACLLMAACQIPSTPPVIPKDSATAPIEEPEPSQPPAQTAALPDLPSVSSIEIDRPELPRYESLELTLANDARFTNPYDQRQVRLEAVFIAPDGTQMNVPGFWDAEAAWRVRFTPSQEGQWLYQVTVHDGRGPSPMAGGTFSVTPSSRHGWLIPGNRFDPAYSGRYLVYHDGTPFYGIGHADYQFVKDGFSFETGVALFDKMAAAGENFVVWWPFYAHSPVSLSYDQYNLGNLKLIDRVVQDAEAKGIFLIFTIWDHPQLRGDQHEWGKGNYRLSNGFKKLVGVEQFFTDPEAWAWQENLYRYLIARWGYSPAIGMWQTVSEINGTNAYENADPWHARLNAYFVENDPYRHPTTASRSGDVDWPIGHAAMDAPQVHVYDLEDPVQSAETLAFWTANMFDGYEKPNWVGEFGVPGNLVYPELFHNAIWAALANGAAMTPAEWNGGGSWMHMTDEMLADIGRLGLFVQGLPLAQWDPARLEIAPPEDVRAWGLSGSPGGLIWVQDTSLQGLPIHQIRASRQPRQGVVLEVVGLPTGTHTVQPYDTWSGTYLEAYELTCFEGEPCLLPLPDFVWDIALRLDVRGKVGVNGRAPLAH